MIDRLAAIDDRIGPVDPSPRAVPSSRSTATGRGCAPPRAKVEDGEPDWFTSPRIDSYHTVWMELHEHLLVALGLERGPESAET